MLASESALSGAGWSGLPLLRLQVPPTERAHPWPFAQPTLLILLRGSVLMHRDRMAEVLGTGRASILPSDADYKGVSWSTSATADFLQVSLPASLCEAWLHRRPGWTKPGGTATCMNDARVLQWVRELQDHAEPARWRAGAAKRAHQHAGRRVARTSRLHRGKSGRAFEPCGVGREKRLQPAAFRAPFPFGGGFAGARLCVAPAGAARLRVAGGRPALDRRSRSCLRLCQPGASHGGIPAPVRRAARGVALFVGVGSTCSAHRAVQCDAIWPWSGLGEVQGDEGPLDSAYPVAM